MIEPAITAGIPFGSLTAIRPRAATGPLASYLEQEMVSYVLAVFATVIYDSSLLGYAACDRLVGLAGGTAVLSGGNTLRRTRQWPPGPTGGH